MRFILLILILLSSSCSGLFYYPSNRLYLNPEQLNLDFKDVWFDSEDGVKLHGWFFPAQSKKTKGTIIQFHGNAQNISTHFLSLIWVIEHGYNLFTWDYRGYGQSDGKASAAGIYKDSLAALKKGRELHQGRGAYIVYGQSLGGAVSLRALPDFEYGNDVSLLVHDSAFASYRRVAAKVLQSRWFLWPFSPFAYVFISDEYAAEKVIDKIHWPTLVIVGEKDKVIAAELGKETYEKLPSDRKWLWELPMGQHIDVFEQEDGRFKKKFLNLLDKMSLE
jgi:uncharacterized protein